MAASVSIILLALYGFPGIELRFCKGDGFSKLVNFNGV